MFGNKRQLKKVRLNQRVKFLIFALLFFLPLVLLLEYIYLNSSFSGTKFISPIANNKNSKTANLEKDLEKAKISFISVSASPDGSLLINLSGGGVVILSSKKDISAQLSSLQLILSRLTIEGKKLKSLDLRFNSPIISF